MVDAHEFGHVLSLFHRDKGQDGLVEPGQKNLMFGVSDLAVSADLDLIQLVAILGSGVLADAKEVSDLGNK